MIRALSRLPFFLLFALPLAAQAGDREGEEQPPLPAELEVPAAPVLSPMDAHATLRVDPGLRIELVAAEPLVVDPVDVAFDGDGRLWVVEMRGYMPDADGRGERETLGAVAVLEDADGDGRMDRRRDFLTDVPLPRAVAPFADGALVIAPPELLFCRDTDGDGRADERTVIDTGLSGLENPEHAVNGLLFGLDNWFYVADAAYRYRFDGGAWLRGFTAGGGQWGITQDELGRLFYNTNSDPLRGDLFPSHYAVRNQAHGRAAGVNVRFAQDMEVWPARINTGVNRGYQPETLKDDWTLARFTAACGPLVYRGGALPADYDGDAFVCEPAANLVKRYALVEHGFGLTAEAVERGREFLTSSDERFRPVNLKEGPDGGLYVVDFYRGLIQHRIYLTSFLRKQVDERGLAAPTGLGRIWRVVPDDFQRAAPPTVADASWTELVGLLSHASGFWRSTAQRVIVAEGVGSRDARELLEECVRGAEEPLARMHALHALAGIGSLRVELVEHALSDPDARVLHAAVRVSEPWLAAGRQSVLEAVVGCARQEDARLRHQVILSLGEAESSGADRALIRFATEDVSTGELRSALLSGLAHRELAFLEALLDEEPWKEKAPGRDLFLRLLARALVRGSVGEAIERLLVLAVDGTESWQRRALFEGILEGRGKDGQGNPAPLVLRGAPGVLPRPDAEDDELHELAAEVERNLVWYGKPGYEPPQPVRPLDEEERERFELGGRLYAVTCAACHQPSGLGEPGKAPSLRGSPFALGSEQRLARILAHGLRGPVTVDGALWDGEMPALVGSDEELAAVATYIRREWGNAGEPVSPAVIASVRASGRAGAWTVAELQEAEADPDAGN